MKRLKTGHVTVSEKRCRGFTLIELLTVIAIIGILAAILVPVVNKVRDSAKAARCTGNLRALALAVNAFADDSRGIIEVWYEGGSGSGGFMWAQQFEDGGYLGSREVLYCPSRHPFTLDEPGTWPWSWRTYGFNMIEGNGGQRSGNNFFQLNVNAVEDLSRHFIFADSFRVGAGGDPTHEGGGDNSQRFSIKSPPGTSTGAVHTRHGGRANLAFLDGHVAAMDARELRDNFGFMMLVNEEDKLVRVPLN